MLLPWMSKSDGGAFMKDLDQARELAEVMVAIREIERTPVNCCAFSDGSAAR